MKRLELRFLYCYEEDDLVEIEETLVEKYGAILKTSFVDPYNEREGVIIIDTEDEHTLMTQIKNGP